MIGKYVKRFFSEIGQLSTSCFQCSMILIEKIFEETFFSEIGQLNVL